MPTTPRTSGSRPWAAADDPGIGIRRLVGVCLLGSVLAACAAERPLPPVPSVTTDTQREQARECQQTYAHCTNACSSQGLSWALGAQQIHEKTKCTNTCKQLLSDCYSLIQ